MEEEGAEQADEVTGMKADEASDGGVDAGEREEFIVVEADDAVEELDVAMQTEDAGGEAGPATGEPREAEKEATQEASLSAQATAESSESHPLLPGAVVPAGGEGEGSVGEQRRQTESEEVRLLRAEVAQLRNELAQQQKILRLAIAKLPSKGRGGKGKCKKAGRQQGSEPDVF